MFKIEEVEVSKIILPKAKFDVETFRRFVINIGINGLMQPPLIGEDYKLIDGFYRVLALKALMYEKVKCKIVPANFLEQCVITASKTHIPMLRSEYAKHLRFLMARKSFANLRAAATYIGVTVEVLKKRLGEHVKDFKE